MDLIKMKISFTVGMGLDLRGPTSRWVWVQTLRLCAGVTDCGMLSIPIFDHPFKILSPDTCVYASRSCMVEESGTLESQLEATKVRKNPSSFML